MIKRAYKEMIAEREIFFVAMIMLCLIMFSMVFVQLLYRKSDGAVCIMDAYAWLCYYLALSIYPITIFTIIALTKNEFKSDKIMRMGSLRKTWIYAVIKTGLASLFLAVMIFLVTGLFGIFVSREFINWDNVDSLCVAVGWGPFTHVNYVVVLLVFFFCVFLGAFVTGVIPVFTYWAGNSYVIGTIISIMICAGGNGSVIDYNTRRGIFYSNISNGIDIKAQFLLPIYVVFVVMILGCFVRKKDFLPKFKT